MPFVEMREYELVVGGAGKYLDAYRTHGYAIQRLHLGEPIGWYTTEVGDLNQVVHLWRYLSFEDRAERRQRLFADPGWLAYISIVEPLVISQRSRIMMEPRLD
jgi:hypothetical protein